MTAPDPQPSKLWNGTVVWIVLAVMALSAALGMALGHHVLAFIAVIGGIAAITADARINGCNLLKGDACDGSGGGGPGGADSGCGGGDGGCGGD